MQFCRPSEMIQLIPGVCQQQEPIFHQYVWCLATLQTAENIVHAVLWSLFQHKSTGSLSASFGQEPLQTVCLFLSTGVQATYLYRGRGSLQECSGPAGASEPILGGQRWEWCRKGKLTVCSEARRINITYDANHGLKRSVHCFTHSAKNLTVHVDWLAGFQYMD